MDIDCVFWEIWEMRGMGRDLSDHHVVLCKRKLEGTWIKRREVVLDLGGLEARNKGNIS